jgi:hypothetical protein
MEIHRRLTTNPCTAFHRYGPLGLLSGAAEGQPLACPADDLQWLNHVTAETLAFVARRLLAEPVAMVFAVRDGGDEKLLRGLKEFVVSRTRALERCWMQ